MRLGQELNERGHTVIVVTHDMDLVAQFTRRTIVLGEGEVLLDGPTSWVFSQPEILRKTFIQPPQITRLAQGLGKYGIPPTLLSNDVFNNYIDRGED
jgi:energy-coupling factor transport system ATP-binding protein